MPAKRPTSKRPAKRSSSPRTTRRGAKPKGEDQVLMEEQAAADVGRPARHATAEDAPIRKFAIEAARLLTDLHCTNAIIFDVRKLSDMTDYIVVGSGTSDRQIKSVGDDVEDLAAKCGLRRFGRELDAPSKWLVLDFVDVMVHLFEPATRAHYDLEMLWGDAPKVTWRR